MYCFAWIVVQEGSVGGLEGRAMTSTMYLPPAVSSLVASGVELGHANDRVFAIHNSKHGQGAVGILTGVRGVCVYVYVCVCVCVCVCVLSADTG